MQTNMNTASAKEIGVDLFFALKLESTLFNNAGDGLNAAYILLDEMIKVLEESKRNGN